MNQTRPRQCCYSYSRYAPPQAASSSAWAPVLASRGSRPIAGVAGRTISYFFFSSRRRHTRLQGDWSSDVCSSDLFKARDGFCPLGPRVVPRAAIANPDALTIRVYLDGELKQTATTAQLVRPVAKQIGRASCRERV